MSWLFDLGNTRLKWARLANGQLLDQGALTHQGGGFDQALDAALAVLPRAKDAFLSSVATTDPAARVRALCARHGVPCRDACPVAAVAGVCLPYGLGEGRGG